MDSSHTIAEYLWPMSSMICDLKAISKEISEEKQVLNVIRGYPWWS